ncbi:MarR family winged helix-turn-helix transcriptional regulator [Kineococcus sp. SYSU DK005]|uniref:MarR family winged helix-turn-helix transcriptional regulator n=1 Tax=Kineococcus sp. SYSU DK005 TaxID=3383126 RepID=UPI003D7E3DEC
MPVAQEMELGYLLVLAGRAVQGASEQAAAGMAISATDLNALYEVSVHGPVLAGTFAQLLGLQQSSITAVADRLEGAGLVQRRRDEHDRRRVWLSITEHGRCTLAQAALTVDAHVAEVFAGLSPGARTALRALLAELVGPWLQQRLPPGAEPGGPGASLPVTSTAG